MKRVSRLACGFSFLLGLALLSGCNAPRNERVFQQFRDPAAPIWSAAAFQPAKIAGSWHQVAGFAAPGEDAGGCGAGGVQISPAGEGLAIAGQLCLSGQRVRLSGPLLPGGPGRLKIAGQPDWWVIWVDSGYRTLAVATPGGEFGFILDRGQISSDRLRAAAEIFDFNGYNKAALKPLR